MTIVPPDSLEEFGYAIANNLLLVGAPFEPGCVFFGPPWVGRADFFQLNRFQP